MHALAMDPPERVQWEREHRRQNQQDAEASATCVGEDDLADELCCDRGFDLDSLLLDAEIRSVLDNGLLSGPEKLIHYHLVVDRYVYKKDPSCKPRQLKIKQRTDKEGRLTYTLREDDRPWYRRRQWKRVSCLSSIVGPVLGALCSIWFRSRGCL